MRKGREGQDKDSKSGVKYLGGVMLREVNGVGWLRRGGGGKGQISGGDGKGLMEGDEVMVGGCEKSREGQVSGVGCWISILLKKRNIKMIISVFYVFFSSYHASSACITF